jgi:hypothetical protein
MPKLQVGLKGNRFYRYQILKQAGKKKRTGLLLYTL